MIEQHQMVSSRMSGTSLYPSGHQNIQDRSMGPWPNLASLSTIKKKVTQITTKIHKGLAETHLHPQQIASNRVDCLD